MVPVSRSAKSHLLPSTVRRNSFKLIGIGQVKTSNLVRCREAIPAGEFMISDECLFWWIRSARFETPRTGLPRGVGRSFRLFFFFVLLAALVGIELVMFVIQRRARNGALHTKRDVLS